jgi:ribosomal protein S18 acetylase RimI-like enzyme
VRCAVVGEEPLLRDLRLQALAEAPEAFGSTYDRELARTPADWQRWLSSGVTLILEDAGKASGLVAGMHDPDDPSIAYLMSMWVHPALRGSGAGDALVTELLAWARSAGASIVRLDVIRTNPRTPALSTTRLPSDRPGNGPAT